MKEATFGVRQTLVVVLMILNRVRKHELPQPVAQKTCFRARLASNNASALILPHT